MSERKVRYFDGKMPEEMQINGNDVFVKARPTPPLPTNMTFKKTLNLGMPMPHKFIIVPLYDLASPSNRDM